MKKRVKPISTPKSIPATPQSTATIVKKPKYIYAGKETLSEIIGKAIPRQLIPTKRMGAIFGFLFLLTLLLAVFTFPLDSLISGNADVSISIGYPYPFLDFALTDTDQSPIRPAGLAIDILIYLFISYVIDVLLTLVLRNPFIGSKEQAEKRPTTFKDQKPKSVSETITKKVFQEPTKKS